MKNSTKLAIAGLLILSILFACAYINSINETTELTKLTRGLNN